MGAPDVTASTQWWQGLNAAKAASTPADRVRALVREHQRWYPRADVALLSRAYAVAEHLHKEQRRKSGEPFIIHPVAVATILAEMGLDTATLVAALLHDTVEDTPFSLAHLAAEFGTEVGVMVDGVTKVDRSMYGSAAAGETFRKMVVAARDDLRVLLIKLADRLHNLRTLQFQPPHKRVKIAQGTRELLIPLAERLGVYRLKRDLEDLCFEYLEGEDFERVSTRVARVRENSAHEVDALRVSLRDGLASFRVKARVEVRPRHPYSVFTSGTGLTGDPDPLDTVRYVVVVKGDERNAYLALGAVHGRWKPYPAKFRDFIATPRYNLYRALHTTVLTESGRRVQIIICDSHAQQVSEYGIIADIRQATGRDGRLTTERTTDPEWLTRLLGWQEQASAEELLEGVRTDLADSITVLTGQGQVLTLPEGATPVDVAYALGADTGDRYSAAAIDGRLVSPATRVREGDTVHIITKSVPAPDRGWLESVRTGRARVAIAAWHRTRAHEEAEHTGRERMIALVGADRLIEAESSGAMTGVARRSGYPSLEELYVALGYEQVGSEDVAALLPASA
ncbi:bifunctional (p)ppGpp synthetase/guanosine-3',5'-bis(diphosphate) 3'-pyrophosphohydrolase [Nocardiopsis akebiae]|uniref:Bifunctional (P)ppGpp synthetase/guanosine-3',5'-bis(Diphosphate) 3'-pyrophosphohydrolase n=1 Tax=Nocardiopsis akebiae TaxID=2831968 RepID=A0ABX8C2H7_9ACTN|nr:HD domain-containing protein [Nocardiopsis akebiae]QUX27637.1 bifunctional (p)ppGpp synthetase/guanosine-3',5'-bis(diphosphate) 3'-pyrophosphohydrolase [Nocardiopsis akebiae]